MNTFEFRGKVYKIVHDGQGMLVEGCKACAFYRDKVACEQVDGLGTGRPSCGEADVHYEEVK
jgi:hypothetical protein